MRELVLKLAKYQFQIRPLPATIAINSGIPHSQRVFWDSNILADIHMLYTSTVATSSRVVDVIQELVSFPDPFLVCALALNN